MRISGPLAVCLFLAATSATAATVSITTRFADATQTSGRAQVGLRAVGRDDAPRVVEIAIPGRLETTLDDGAVWQIELRSTSYWARPLSVDVHADRPNHFVLDVRRAGTLTGRLRDIGDIAEKNVRVRFTAAGTAMGNDPDLSECTLGADARFVCVVPAGDLDLRLSVPHRVPTYRWQTRVVADRATDLGDLTPLRGGSIAGVVDLPNGDIAAEKVRIHVRAAGGDAHELLAHPRHNGFFETGALAPGRYEVRAELDGYVAVPLPPIEVRDGLEARLPEPLALRAPGAIAVAIDPPLDAGGNRWRVELLQAAANRIQHVASGTASAEGGWENASVAPGDYVVVVSDAAGSPWSRSETSVAAETTRQVEIHVPVVEVDGTLRSGATPIAGTLWFGTRSGIPSIRAEADELGHFHVALPRGGAWDIDLVRAASGEETRLRGSVRDVDERHEMELVLPDVYVQGRAVTESGEAVEGAVVTFADRGEPMATVTTTRDGSFSAYGLPARTLYVSASSAGLASELAEVQVREDATPPIRITMHPHRVVRGRVVGPAGPVAGARIALWPELGVVNSTISDSDGHFEVPMPPAAEVATLAVYSPGLALHVRGVAMSASAEPLVIPLTSVRGSVRVSVDAENPEQRITFIESNQRRIPASFAVQLVAPSSSADAAMRTVMLGDLPPGEFRACTGTPLQPERCAAGSIAPASELTLHIR